MLWSRVRAFRISDIADTQELVLPVSPLPVNALPPGDGKMTATLTASALATGPRAQIPELDRPLPPAELEAALRSFHGSYYVQHPFHRLMYEGKLTPRQFQGWAANRLAYQRVVPRKDAAILMNCPDPEVRRVWIERIIDHDGTAPGHRRHRALDPARRRARRAPRGDGGRAPRAARRAAHLRVVRHVLPAEAVGRGGRGVAHGAVRAEDPRRADRGVSQALPVDPARGTRLLQEPAGAGAAGRDPRARHRAAALHDGGDSAQGVRGAPVQARHAVGDDRQHPSCVCR